MVTFTDAKFATLGGNNTQFAWNKKLCFEARDALYECVDSQPNGNKLRCPDQLYAYEMWCPTEFRRIHSYKKHKDQRDEKIYDQEWLQRYNIEKQTILPSRSHAVATRI